MWWIVPDSGMAHDSTRNFFTVDLEEWYCVNYAGIDTRRYETQRSELPRLVDRFLELFARVSARCTFFVLGATAEKYPETIRKIHAAGHEVASHGYGHGSVKEMTPAGFRADLERASGILEGICGARVLGFRAPSFSITSEILPWYYGTLEELGYRYSSSAFSGKTFLYGISDFPYRIHRPAGAGWRTRIVEFPITRVRLGGKALPLYLRMFPAWYLRQQVEQENAAGRPAMLYVHPREIDSGQPRLPLKGFTRFIHYYGISGCESKLVKLLSGRRFVSIQDYLAENFPAGA